MREVFREQRGGEQREGVWGDRELEAHRNGEGVSLSEAKEIFGTSLLDIEALREALGMELDEREMRRAEKVPFTRAELERARELGMRLVFRVSRDRDGAFVTINRLREIARERYPRGDALSGKANIFEVPHGGWYEGERFAREETPRAGWQLIGRNALVGSVGKSWREQETLLRSWAQDHGFPLQAVRRRMAVEVALDVYTQFVLTGESSLQVSGDWTQSRSASGKRIAVGWFGVPGRSEGGLSLEELDPERGYPSVGVYPVIEKK
jgi:hypothetical protein